MNLESYLLVCLMEECAEIQQAVAKSIRFGLDDHHPSRKDQTNQEELLEEFYQCVAVVEMLQEKNSLHKLSETEIDYIKKNKKEKVIKYMQYSKDKGQLL
ncbi:hypothetical protein J8385_19150 [Acinetobacter baumannii]|nr:hypothetical protein [Acinetobacter baumannii]